MVKFFFVKVNSLVVFLIDLLLGSKCLLGFLKILS